VCLPDQKRKKKKEKEDERRSGEKKEGAGAAHLLFPLLSYDGKEKEGECRGPKRSAVPVTQRKKENWGDERGGERVMPSRVAFSSPSSD